MFGVVKCKYPVFSSGHLSKNKSVSKVVVQYYPPPWTMDQIVHGPHTDLAHPLIPPGVWCRAEGPVDRGAVQPSEARVRNARPNPKLTPPPPSPFSGEPRYPIML